MRPKACFALLAVLLLAAGQVAAGEPQEPAEAPEAAMMETYMKLATPGEHHKHLAHGVGTWDCAIKMWMAPGSPPMESTGVAEMRWVLGGRFVETVYKSNEPFMGQSFEGRGLDGYDNHAQKYVGSWVDTMGTMMATSEGHCDGSGKVRTMVSEFTDPMSGQEVTTKSVTKVVDADTFTVEMYVASPDGGEFKNFEMTAKRRK